MAQNKTTGAIGQTAGRVMAAVNKTGEATENAVNKTTDAITALENTIGSGITLNEKKPKSGGEDKKDRVGEIIPLAAGCQDLLQKVLDTGHEISDIEKRKEDENGVIDSDEDNNEKKNLLPADPSSKAEIDANADQFSILKNSSNLFSLIGNGFTITGNLLYGVANEILEKLDKFAKDGAGSPAAAPVSVTANEAEKESKKEKDSANPGKTFSQYMRDLAGPLESIASGVMMLSIAVAILSVITISPAALVTVAGMVLFLTALITGLAAVEAKLGDSKTISNVDEEGKPVEKKGTVYQLIDAVTNLVKQITISLLLMALLVKVMDDQTGAVFFEMVKVILLAVATVTLMEVISRRVEKILPEPGDEKKQGKSNSGVLNMVKGITNIIMTLVILALVCNFAWQWIEPGLLKASMIFMAAATFTLIIAALANRALKDANPDVLNAFTNLMKTITSLLLVVTVLAVILGIIPEQIILKGISNVLIIGSLTMGLLFMLTKSIKQLEKVSEDKLKTLMGILITVTVLIAILGILTLFLAQQDPVSLMMATTVMAILLTVPLVAIRVLSKINMGDALKAIPVIIITGVIIGLLAYVVYQSVTILAKALGQVENAETMMLLLGVIAVATLLVIAVSLSIVAMAALAGPTTASVGPAIATIIVATIVIVAMGVLVLAVSKVAKDMTEEQLQVVGKLIAIIGFTVVLVMAVAAAIIGLAALAVALSFSVGMAILAIGAVVVFIGVIAGFIYLLYNTELPDTTILTEKVEQLGGIVKALAGLAVPMIELAGIGAALAVATTIAAAGLIATMISFVFLTLSLWGIYGIISKWPNLEEVAGPLEKLGNLVETLNTLNERLEDFSAPTDTKRKEVIASIKFFNKFANELSKLESPETEAIANFANNLSELANSADGLVNVAQALRDIAEATKELDTDKLSALEKLTGTIQLSVDKGNEIHEMAKEKREAEREENSSENTLQEIRRLLQAINDSIDKLPEPLNAVAEQNKANGRLPGSNSNDDPTRSWEG